MAKGNGKIIDEGLAAIKASFDDAVYPDDDAEECANLLMLGEHRNLQIPDSAAMELYAMMVVNEPAVLTRTNSEGQGYRVKVSNFSELAALFRQELDAEFIGEPS